METSHNSVGNAVTVYDNKQNQQSFKTKKNYKPIDFKGKKQGSALTSLVLSLCLMADQPSWMPKPSF